MIKHYNRQNIDIEKWDNCIKNAQNGLIYAYSWYLDCVAENWDALVEDDYLSVFPLTWKKKYGIKYICQPFFCQQLGIFSINQICVELIQSFLKAIPWYYVLVDTNMNNANNMSESKNMKPRINYLLSLNKSHQVLFANYDKNNAKNILKARRNELSFAKNVSCSELICQFQNAYGKYYPNITEKDYGNLVRLIGKGARFGCVELVGVNDKNGSLCASALFFYSHKRYYYVLGSPSEAGRNNRAIYFLLDEFIHSKSETEAFIDFEGSEIPNVAYFYKNFGAVAENYYHLLIKRYKFWE